MSDDVRWIAAFDALREGQRVMLNGKALTIDWKHPDPRWLRLRGRGGRDKLIIRQGEKEIFELQAAP